MENGKRDGSSLVADVLAVVAGIPRGKVATYGQIADLAGHPGASRSVGRALQTGPHRAELPRHRVVNSSGRTAPGWDSQRDLLEAEGVTFRENGCVDMAKHAWSGPSGAPEREESR
jgi:methylated-DNA-protein-cysteine methyltransferase-like protein